MHGKLIRRLVSLAAGAAISFTAAALPAQAGWEHIGYLGDLNNDKEVNVADLVIMAKHMRGNQPLTSGNSYNVGDTFVGLSGQEGFYTEDGYLCTADIDQNGRVDIYDYIRLRRYTVSNDPEWVWAYNEDTQTTTTTTTTVTSTTSFGTTTVQYTDDTGEFISPPVSNITAYLPSQGDANLVIFYVDFPDCKYSVDVTAEQIEKIAFSPADESSAYYPFESMTGFYARSSKGAMELRGKAFRYTAKESVSSYNKDKNKLLKECYEAFNSEVDFAQFDGDNDGYIDTTLLSVPEQANNSDDDWWPCAGPSELSYSAKVRYDGKAVGHLITGNAQIDSLTDYKNFCTSYLHEMGHCMGLPDYYLYDNDTDWEGMHGAAGNELMDADASSDLSCVSKLQLGWYRDSQIQVYDSSHGAQTFTLSSAQTDAGNCVIIPRGTLDSRYQSEYFMVEFFTPDGNSSASNNRMKIGRGIRVYHVEATVYDYGNWVDYMYCSGSDFTNNDTGIRFIRIIDDTDTQNYYTAGDVIDSSIDGFNWYDESGGQSIDPGIRITVGELTNGQYTVTIS